MNRERAVQKRKCFKCGGFRYIVKNYRIKKVKKVVILESSDKFQVLASRVMNIEEESEIKVKKDRKMVLKEERVKKKKERLVEVRKIKKEELLREVMVKIELERIDMQEEIMVEVLLNSSVTRLVMSLEFVKKQEFKFLKIKGPIYICNVNSFSNKKESIKYIMEVNIYY